MVFAKNVAKRLAFASMATVALAIFGPFALESRATDEGADRVAPTISVVTLYASAPAQDVEIYVTQVLEEAVMSIHGVALIESESRKERSQIKIEFAPNQDAGIALSDVREAVARVTGKLPSNVEAPTVTLGEADTGQVSQRPRRQ